MIITLHAVGKGMPAWVEAGFTEYQKRMPFSCRLQLHEVALQKRSKNSALKQLIEKESDDLLASIPANRKIIALNVTGQCWSTEELSAELKNWMQEGQDVSLLVGGPDGLSSECLKKTNTHWSLSRLTLPHPLVRIIVAEQLYRAYSYLQNHPYHRGA